MLMEQYFENMKKVQDKIETTQKQSIKDCAKVIADSITNDGIWHILDTGHMLMYEAVGRTGGLMAARPVRISVDVSNPTRYREKIKEKMPAYLDEIEGFPQFVIQKSNMMAGDVLMIGSVSGKNILPVELALTAKKMGIHTIALTSVEYSSNLKSEHPSGKRLFEVCDYVLDNCTNMGDTLVPVEELGFGICPASGIGAAYLVWALEAEIVELMLQRGKKPSVYISNHMPNGLKHNREAWSLYEKQGY